MASAVITPSENMWMAGYASRQKPSEGKIHDLKAKALAIEDSQGARLVIVSLDLVAVPRELRDWLETEANRRYGLPPGALVLNASHTHCGPELRVPKYEYGKLADKRLAQGVRYVERLKTVLVGLIGKSLSNLAPARIGFSQDKADFAMNRRLKTPSGYANSPNKEGPVDHDVPVLRVESPQGKLRAVVFGYACHNTTLNFYHFSGDYAGFAQLDVEMDHPGATAMFLTGCGADQNPEPRRTLDLCVEHGRKLADAVSRALAGPARPLEGQLKTAMAEIELEFAPPPTEEELRRLLAESTSPYEKRHAELLLAQLESKGRIETRYPYLAQVVRLGPLTMIAMSGEVVVDYSLYFKEKLKAEPVWVMGYSNDVFGYLPSARVLKEGGYEGGGAMTFTSFPGPFADSVEQRVVTGIDQLLDQTAGAAAKR